MTDTWQDVPAAPARAAPLAPAGPADGDWQDVPPPAGASRDLPAPPGSSQGISDRLSKGFMPANLTSYVLRKLPDIAGDTAEFFHQGVSQAADAIMGNGPSQFDDIRPEVEKQLIGIGRTPEAAKQETDALMRSWRRQERMGGAIMGPMTALTAPLLGAYRSLISRPLEEIGGPPKEVTEMAGMVAGAVAGMPAMGREMARVRVSPDGKVSAQRIGELPKGEDFKTAADLLTEQKGANLSDALQKSQRTVMGESVIDPHAAEILGRGADLGKVEQALSNAGISDLKPLSGGFSSVVLDADTKVVRLGRGELRHIPDIPEYVKPIAEQKIGGVSVEILPKVDTTGITAADVQQMKETLATRGLKWGDAAEDNLGRGPDGKLYIIDGPVTRLDGLKIPSAVAPSLEASRPVDPAITEQNLRTLWDERGIHPAEALDAAKSDAFLKYELTQPPIEAFHGSPYEFTEFDMSKIDTGQGAQVYGHGLYFAEHPDVAASYRFHNKAADLDLPFAERHASFFLRRHNGDRAAAIRDVEDNIRIGTEDRVPDREVAQDRKALDVLNSDWQPPHEVLGSLYRVRIHANPEHMIDFTKNLDEQSPFVLQAFERLRDTIKAENPMAQSGLMLDSLLGDKNKALQKVLDATKGMGAKAEESKSTSFDDFYRQFAKYDFDQISATEMMRDAGIPGIKYLDQQSRIGGGNTRNFVVFKDEDVQITHINDQPFYDQRFKQAVDARDARIIQGLEEPPSFEPPPAPHPDRPLGEALRATDELRAANRNLPAQDRAILGELISAVRSAAAKRQLSVEDGVVQQGDRFSRKPLVTPDTGPERVVGATVIVDGKVFIGSSHLEALEKARSAGHDLEQYRENLNEPGHPYLTKGDFITSNGRLLSTEEAANLTNERNAGIEDAYKHKTIRSENAQIQKADVEKFSKQWSGKSVSELAGDRSEIAEHAWVEADQDLARAQAAMARIEEVKARHPELAPTIDRAVQAVEDTLAQRDAMKPGADRPLRSLSAGTPLNEKNSFAFRVLTAADEARTPIGKSADQFHPDKIAISDLYQEYARLYGARNKDPLQQGEFKQKLLEAAQRGEVELARLDMPEMLDRPRALNSAIKWGDSEVHFLVKKKPSSLGAASSSDPPMTPLTEQPPAPAGALMASAQEGIRSLFDIGRDIQMKVAPMATGTRDSILAAKDFANTMRKNRWEWSRIHDYLTKNFTPEQLKRMWDAADEESVLRQEGKTSEHMGLATLEPNERAIVEGLHLRAQNAWLRALDLGMVQGEGLPFYTPRMIINAAGAIAEQGALPLNSMGTNLKASTARLMKRKYLTAEETEAAAKGKYGEQAELARDIRTLPLATAQLEDAIAGRTLVNEIKKAGMSGGSDTVAEGAIPKGSEDKWFTIDHPALKTWRPKFEEVDGKLQTVKDADGNVIFEQVPIYIRGDFEGPLRAVLDTKSGAAYQAMMSLKGKTMSVIMYSPAIHNLVEFGRAFPAMPTRIFKAYFDGNRAKNDVAIMTEAIDSGLVPIGKRFFNQDIDAIMESPDLTPGRSWTAKVLAAVPGLFDEGAGTAVKRAVDKAGDFWHNTLLWDRIGDLQMGLYTNLRGDLIGKGVDAKTASITAAHWANRYAGALPQEAMSSAARKSANMLLFSRSFTMGNLGVMKDMVTGLPKDALAMIEREGGFKPGSLSSAEDIPQVGDFTKGMARRKAIAVVMLDIGLMYVGNSVLQSTFNVMLGDKTIDEEAHGYTRRMKEVLNDVNTHPLSLLQPFSLAERLSATGENEPGRRDRIRIGYQSDGTAIYARNPVGKIGEEFIGYMSNPLEMLRKKEGTVARPLLQIFSNDKGFGRKVYDPNAETPMDKAAAIWAMVEHFAKAQTPEGQINALSDLVKGEGDPKTSTLQTLGPFAGVTFSKGAPGGPATGELYDYRQRHDVKVNMALPDIRKQILRGDVGGALQRMRELDVPPGLQRFYIRTTLDPSTRVGGRTLRDFYMGATSEQRERLERARQ